MKQNEKILVYAVTGFLVVILMLAVVLGSGKDNGRQAPGANGANGSGANGSGANGGKNEMAAAPSLEELLERNKPKAGDGKSNELGAQDANGGKSDGSAVPAVGGDKPLAANVQILPPTASSMVTEKLGLSRKENGFRVVRAQSKDTLSGLVQKWCGKTEDYLEQAQGLNETLTTLRPGDDITLPWVDDEALLAAWEARHPVAAPAPGGNTPDVTTPAVKPAGSPTNPASLVDGSKAAPSANGGNAAAAKPNAAASKPVATGGRKIKLKAGDTLWQIAEKEVGRKAAGKFVQQIRELNPGIDPDHLREGVELQLPAGEKTN